MPRRETQHTPYHSLSSILNLGESQTGVYVGKPSFNEALQQPHRSAYYCILLLTEGTIQQAINIQENLLQPGCMAFTSPGIINWWTPQTERLDGYSLMFTADFYSQGTNDVIDLNRFPFFQWDAVHSIHLNASHQREIEVLMDRMIKEYENKKLKSDSAIRSLINILLIELERIYIDIVSFEEENMPKGIKLASSFKCMVSHQFRENRLVQEYAEMLNVTANHLNDTVKSVTGKSAGALINDMTILESKILLDQTDLTIAEIAYHLNFKDPSYFGRFFKKHTGLTPLIYRTKQDPTQL